MNNRNSVWDTIPELLPYALELRACQPKLSFELITAMLNERFALKLTRNSVIGRLFRYHHPQQHKHPKTHRASLRRRAMSIADHVPSEPHYETVSFEDLRDWHCRFPSGDHPHIVYCGCPKTSGSYCDEHHKKAYYIFRTPK